MASACVFIECPVTKMILGVSRKDDPNAWGLPGGKIEEHETEVGAAWRELFEETGLFMNVNHFDEIFRREGGVTFAVSGRWWDSLRMHQQPSKAETGRVGWVTVEQLLKGPFGDYNRALLLKLGRIKEHCPVRLAGGKETFHAPCDTGDFGRDH